MTVADSIREIADNPTPDAIGDLYRLALSVEKMERSLDEEFANAREDERLKRLFMGKAA
jgi:hypothetical protein